jgi:hypothetical protein
VKSAVLIGTVSNSDEVGSKVVWNNPRRIFPDPEFAMLDLSGITGVTGEFDPPQPLINRNSNAMQNQQNLCFGMTI